MKNKVSIFAFISFLCVLFFQAQMYCEESKLKVSIAPELGFLSGEIVENVWYVNSSENGSKTTLTPTTRMSRLDWQIENSFNWGFNTDFTFNNKYTFLFSIKNAISQNCGVMEDYDWLNPITRGWLNDPADELTNYSIHTNYMNNYTHINFMIGRIFYLGQNKNIGLTPLFGIDIENISMSGISGWYTYKKDNWKKFYFDDEKVISYSQSYAAPILLLNADFNFARYFEVCLGLSAVWIKELDCIDLHHAKNTYYNDRIENAWNFGAELKFFFKIKERNKIGIKGGINYIPDAYGFTYNSKTDTMPDTTSLGGTSRLIWNYSLVYVFRF